MRVGDAIAEKKKIRTETRAAVWGRELAGAKDSGVGITKRLGGSTVLKSRTGILNFAKAGKILKSSRSSKKIQAHTSTLLSLCLYVLEPFLIFPQISINESREKIDSKESEVKVSELVREIVKGEW